MRGDGRPDRGSAPSPAGDLAQRAAELAEGHSLRAGWPAPLRSIAHLEQIASYLEQLRPLVAAAQPEGSESRAAEWFLDNDFLLLRTIRQVAKDLPPGFYRRLPVLRDGRPRVHDLARELLSATAFSPDQRALVTFVAAYQGRHTLRTAEIWALPSMLRAQVIERSLRCLADLSDELAPPYRLEPLSAEEDTLECGEELGRCIGLLRELATLRWNEFFREVSAVERILARDPAEAYARMDEETRDRYRRVVEEIAWRAGVEEVAVAERAVQWADRGDHDHARGRHVGHWLVGTGDRRFEASFDYRAPPRLRLRRLLNDHPSACYLGAVAAALTVLWLGPTIYLLRLASGPWVWLATVLFVLPASVLAVTVVRWALTTLLQPRMLPKMDFARGIPDDCRTMVVVPTLLGSLDEVEVLVRQLEKHYLANPDPNLEFAILGDYIDAPTQHTPDDEQLLGNAEQGVRLLNRKYGSDGARPFHLFHRERRWNPGEDCWMGWERKRGKLEEFNRLLAGEDDTTYVPHVGSADALDGIRFVITLDSDTILPHGCAARLVGTLAHPLNEALFDEQSGRIVEGYTVVQPRVEVSPSAPGRTKFSRIYAGDTSIDIYSRAVSDVYQDLSGTGAFIGKGIYEVASFRRSLEGRVPENTLLSHDLFEGVHGRAALATDIVLFEDYPVHYLSFARRMHRWIRGDWQILPWLMPRVPLADGSRARNQLNLLARWKILDNLRRSLVSPSLLLLLVAGWLMLPGNPWIWTLLALLVPAGHIFIELATDLARARRGSRSGMALVGLGRSLPESLARWTLFWAFLAHETFVIVDAIWRTLYRMWVSSRRLLEWRSAAHTDRLFAKHGLRSAVWLEMASGPLVVALLGWATFTLRPGALPAAAPLLALWLLSPEIALFLNRPLAPRRQSISEPERRELRTLARHTWLFFETFVGPEDQWLPPDNFQEHPRGKVAHRTSPTNIGMLLVSTVSAYRLGYLTVTNLVFRLRNALDAIDRLEHHHGHLLNWYDTRDLRPLEPRYVSTVDSGNLAGNLLVVERACAGIATESVLRGELWEGLRDSLELLVGVVDGICREARDPEPWRAIRSRIARTAQGLGGLDEGAQDLLDWTRRLERVFDEECAEIDRSLVEALRESEIGDPELLRELRVWLDDLHEQLRNMRHEVSELMPWVHAVASPPASLEEAQEGSGAAQAWATLRTELRRVPRLDEIPAHCERVRIGLEALEAALTEPQREALEAWVGGLRQALEVGEANARSLHDELLAMGARAEAEVVGMDFAPLYDEDRDLFRIGINISANRPDPNHYDLLASEARLASFLAIAKGDVPLKHWFFLGRPATRASGRLTLLSWGATAFEYLMPALLMRSGPDTFLARSCRAAVNHQIAYGRSKGVPWGISEAGYYHFDPDQNYQYRAFGVPGLGFKRGLRDDLVVAPYASLLALTLRPHDVMSNIAHLRELGSFGRYGLYEALDFTPTRVPAGRSYALVQSYMAHHQGMILSSIANYLGDGVLSRLFHASTIVQTTEMLLHEQVPSGLSLEDLRAELEPRRAAPAETVAQPAPWAPRPGAAWPEVHTLSNGSLTEVFSDWGGGYLSWNGLALTRWAPDATRDSRGFWTYVRDEETGELWSTGLNPTAATPAESHLLFHAGKIELNRRDHGIFLGLEVCVAPDADVEIRHISLTNETARSRELSIVSYAEVALSPRAQSTRHPAFDKLFVESEYVPEDEALIFTRRPRSPEDSSPVLLHRFVAARGSAVRCVGYESDRERFLGRLGTARRPRVLEPGSQLGEGATGAVLDPVLALQAVVTLPPGGRAELAFVTLVAPTRDEARRLARRFDGFDAIGLTFAGARLGAARELAATGVALAEVSDVQRLLSVLLIPRPGLRPPGETLAATRFGKPRLWGHGVSGDVPILVLRLRDVHDTALLEECLRAHHLLRLRGQAFALLILREGASGYEDDVQGPLQRVIESCGAQEWMNRRGGVFLIRSDQIPSEERQILLASARAVLDTSRGSLRRHLDAVRRTVQDLPTFVPQLAGQADTEPTPELEREEGLDFENPWGGFAEQGAEYVIHLERGRPTPAPWCNVLANPSFGTLLSESGLGCTWSVNAGEHRLTPWRNDPVGDEPGEALFLRDEETAAVWSTTPQPAPGEGPYQVRHGIGYSVWRHNGHGLVQEMRVYVSPDEPVKYVRLRLRNVWGRRRRLTATYYAEWVLGTTREECQAHVVPSFDAEIPALLARCGWNPDFAGRTAFLVSDGEIHGFTCDRREFLGRESPRERPAALDRWGLAGTVEPGRDPCAALQVHLELDPGQEVEVLFALGEGETRRSALELARLARQPVVAERTWKRVGEFWEGMLSSVQVRTPEPSFDLLINRWLPYQLISGRLFGRTGFYQSSGAYGFRDQLQDALALVSSRPDVTRTHILEAARHQFEEGDVLHWWHPPGDRGVRTRCSDDLLWLVYCTAHYVRATGDESILSEQVPFLVADPLTDEESDRFGLFEASAETHELFEHCRRALQRSAPRGAHGLPLIGDGDWNDGMNALGREGRGESVWVAWFLCANYEAFAELCRRRSLEAESQRWREASRELAQAIEREAWDGEWYRRAYDDEGRPIGSKESVECRIDSIVQSWSVLSGAGNPERAAIALDSALERLVREDERLVLLLEPPFDGGLQNPGYIRGYPPGVRENGGQYTHAAAWLAWAFAERGDGETAERIFRLINPLLRTRSEQDCRRYRVEPYVIPADVYGAEPHSGRGGWTWYTGAAAWTWRLGVEAILGLRLVGGDLEIDPSLPPGWEGFEATVRTLRGEFRIRYESPDGAGAVTAELDGVPIEGCRIPLASIHGEHEVSVR